MSHDCDPIMSRPKLPRWKAGFRGNFGHLWRSAISEEIMVWLPLNEKQIHRLDARPQIWPSVMTLTMTLTLDFQGQILNLLYILKMSQLPRNKYKLIKGILGLKCDHSFGPRPWPWPPILNVKYLIYYISRKYGPNATKRETYISIECWASSVITLAMTLTFFFRLCHFKCQRDIDSSSWPP